MKTRQLICAAFAAMSCLAGAASAQDSGRRGPNVMSAPQQGRNYSNNTNTHDEGDTQSRRGPNTMRAPEPSAQARSTPRTGRMPAPADNTTQARPEAAERSGPNIVGEPAGLSMPEDDRNTRRSGCERCVAI